ncbi:TPA: hypothetical protein U1C91_000588 [Streptococcus suis]|nr:hypothetical protein [Streptococcus suis]HEM3699880.1 hypothetical protein [Streptococcus suis]
MNHAPTLLKARGKTIKQGDTSSLLVFELQNSLHEPMSELEGKQATVTFKCDEGIAFRKTLTVTESKIQFTIDTVLAVGVYDVEVTCEGYIFPSSPTVTIQVTQSHKEYTDVASPEEVPSVDKILQLIAQNRYDDSELRELITQLSNHEDKDTVYDDTALQERVTALETRPEPVAYDDAPLQLEIRRLATSSSELAEKVQALEERPDDSELRRKLETNAEAINSLVSLTNQSIKEVSVVNRLIYDMPGFEFYNTDKSVKNLAAYLHDNRLNYSNGNSGFMGRVNHNELVAITTDSSNGTGKKLTLAYQPRRLPDNFRLLGYTDGYRYDTVRSSEVDAIGSNGSSLAIFFIGTNPTFYVMHPADMRLELVSEYNDYGSGMVRAIKHCSLIEYNSRFSISKLNFLINNVDTMGRFVEYKAILRLVSN